MGSSALLFCAAIALLGSPGDASAERSAPPMFITVPEEAHVVLDLRERLRLAEDQRQKDAVLKDAAKAGIAEADITAGPLDLDQQLAYAKAVVQSKDRAAQLLAADALGRRKLAEEPLSIIIAAVPQSGSEDWFPLMSALDESDSPSLRAAYEAWTTEPKLPEKLRETARYRLLALQARSDASRLIEVMLDKEAALAFRRSAVGRALYVARSDPAVVNGTLPAALLELAERADEADALREQALGVRTALVPGQAVPGDVARLWTLARARANPVAVRCAALHALFTAEQANVTVLGCGVRSTPEEVDRLVEHAPDVPPSYLPPLSKRPGATAR